MTESIFTMLSTAYLVQRVSSALQEPQPQAVWMSVLLVNFVNWDLHQALLIFSAQQVLTLLTAVPCPNKTVCHALQATSAFKLLQVRGKLAVPVTTALLAPNTQLSTHAHKVPTAPTLASLM